MGWLALLRLSLRRRARHGDDEGSMPASAGASLDENRTEQTRPTRIAGLLLASLALLR